MTPQIAGVNQFFDGGYYGPQLLLLFLLARRSSPRGRELAAVSGGDRHRRAGHCGAGHEACAAAGLVVPLSFNILVLRGSEYELLNWRFTGHFS